MRTKHGVYYDVKLSTYIITLNGYSFYFSSKSHLNKFEEQYKDYANKISESLSNRFDMKIVVRILAYIHLYRKIETRGFYITNKDGEEVCQNNLILGCEKVIMRESTKKSQDLIEKLTES